MPETSQRPKLSEKGLLTPDNAVLAMIDLQPQMLFGVSNFDRQTIINNVLLAEAARVFGVPVVLSTVETQSFSGLIWQQIQAVFPGRVPIERTSMNSWDDAAFCRNRAERPQEDCADRAVDGDLRCAADHQGHP